MFYPTCHRRTPHPHFGDDRVINDASFLVGEAAQAPRPILQPGDVADNKRLGEGDGVLALESERGNGRARVAKSRELNGAWEMRQSTMSSGGTLGTGIRSWPFNFSLAHGQCHDGQDAPRVKYRDWHTNLERNAAHVRDVENRPGLATMGGRVHDRILVLDRHRPTSERDHLAYRRGIGKR